MGNSAGILGAERLFPFAIKARLLVVGRQRLQHDRKKLQFLLLTTDISENSRREMLKGVAPLPVVQHYTSAEVEKLLQLKGTKVLGFRQSPLSRTIFEGLQEFVIQTPPPLDPDPDPDPDPLPPEVS